MKPPFAQIDRRSFLRTSAFAGFATGLPFGGPVVLGEDSASVRPRYTGPNVILIRWGGGARRRESIHPQHTLAPYLCHELIPQGVLYPKMEIAQFEGLNTSHGEGTLNLITGKYDRYRDAADSRPDLHPKFLGARFEAKVPTLFEYLRESYDISDHQALIINGEDRADEEFYNFSNHHLFGVRYRSQTLSLRRYKTWLLREKLRQGTIPADHVETQRKELAKLESLDYRLTHETGQGAAIDGFWSRWRGYYGDSGLVNPRGDRLLTELSIRAIRELRPRLLMVNYQDCDYVHWGYLDHYTRAVGIMDEGVRSIVQAVAADPEYRENTVFALVPDCGRDDNPFVDVPCQHHFGSRSAHEIFALFWGAGIAKKKSVHKLQDQTSIATTLGALMKVHPAYAEGNALEEVFA